MAKTIRLTESELKSMIAESVKRILKEGYNDNPSYTHYAVLKDKNKIVNGWDFRGIESSELRQFANEYCGNDLKGNGINPKEVKIWTRNYCMRNGVDPSDDNNWSNYPMSESLIKEIGDTPKGQRALGGLTARKKLAHKDHMPTYRYAEKARGGDDWDKFAYPNATIDAANPMYKDYAQGYTDYLNAHPDEMMDYERKKYLKEATTGYSTTTIDIDLSEIEFPQPLNDFVDDNYDSMPDTVEVEISYKYNPYTPATYWQPAEGGDFDYSCSDVLVEPFQDIIPQELLQTFIDTIGDYADAHIDELFERANINYDDGPDPDEAYENWRDSQYED